MNSQFDHLVPISSLKEEKLERLTSVSVATFDHNVWVRIVGRASFQSSIDLKEWIQPIIEQRVYNYIIDLVDCEQMDSTFMGTLAGIAQRLRAKKQGILRVVNVSEVNRELMEGLGLDQLFPIQRLSLGREVPPFSDTISFQKIVLSHQDLSETGVVSAVREVNGTNNKSEHANSKTRISRKQDHSGIKVDLPKFSEKESVGEVVLSAHESLVSVNKNNKKKFKNLMEVMRQRLRR